MITHWLEHAHDCLIREFGHEQYAATAREIHPNFHVVSPKVYAMIGEALHQNLAETIGNNLSTEEEI